MHWCSCIAAAVALRSLFLYGPQIAVGQVFETELGCSSQGRVDATGLSRDLTSYWMVVRPSGHLVGALRCKKRSRKEAELIDVVVERPARKKGILRTLLSGVEKELVHRGVRRTFLWGVKSMPEEQTARAKAAGCPAGEIIPAYKKYGYCLTGQTHVERSTQFDMCRMEKSSKLRPRRLRQRKPVYCDEKPSEGTSLSL